MTLLRVDNVSKRFGSLTAIEERLAVVEPGELRAIIGPNGAGKTTFFNLISGLFRADLRRVCSTTGRDRPDAGGAGATRHGAHLPDHRDLSDYPCAKTCASRWRSPRAMACRRGCRGVGEGGRRAARRIADHGQSRRQARRARRRAVARRPARRGDHDGAGAEAAPAAARRTDRRHGRSGDLRRRAAGAPPAPQGRVSRSC